MNPTILSNISILNHENNNAEKHALIVWETIQSLHIEFELNPKSLGKELIEILETTVNEFAQYLKTIIFNYDDQSKKQGELSLKILKLCMRLQDKIYFFYNRAAQAFSAN